MPARQFAQFLQHLSSLTRRQRDRLLPFRGIASRYLSHYFGWRWADSTLNANSAKKKPAPESG